MFKRFRSARTGLFVSRAQADANRDTTTAETDRTRSFLPVEVERAALNCIERNGVDATLERLAD